MSNEEKAYEAIANALHEADIHFEQYENHVFYFAQNILGRITLFGQRVFVLDQTIMVDALFPVHIPTSSRNIMAEFVCRVNKQLPNGMLLMDFGSGELQFRYSLYIGAGLPEHNVLKNAITMPRDVFEIYGMALMEVLRGQKSPEEAVASFFTATD